jgi:hypothetical protein
MYEGSLRIRGYSSESRKDNGCPRINTRINNGCSRIIPLITVYRGCVNVSNFVHRPYASQKDSMYSGAYRAL